MKNPGQFSVKINKPSPRTVAMELATHEYASQKGRIIKAAQNGRLHDATQASALLEGQAASVVIADKAYDSNGFRKQIAVILSKRNRKVFIPHDQVLYKNRNSIERCFNRLKHFRRFATRYNRRTIHFTGLIYLAAAMIWIA